MADFNIFGSAPEYLTGLLGQQGVEDLQKKALTTGLINAAIGYIAQPKNQRLGGALPYVGRALQAGMTGAQGVYDQGLKGFEIQQKIDEINRQKEQRVARETAISQLPPEQQLLYRAYGEGAVPRLVEIAMPKPKEKKFEKVGNKLLEVSGESPVVAYTGESEEKGFGTGVQGTALNYLVQGSGNTPEAVAFRSTPNYALAYREVNKPVPVQVEELQLDGSVRQVTKMIAPPPLPKSILPPVFGQQEVHPVSSQPRVADNRPRTTAPGTTTPIVAEDYTGGEQYNIPGGVKSSPYAPSQTEIKDYRDKKNQSLRLKSTLSDLQDFVNKNPDPNLWGVGRTGAKLQSKYEDALTQMRLSAELGVLNKEDLPRLQAALPNPSDVKTWIKGGGTLDSFAGAVEAQNERLDRDINFYNTYLNPGAKQKAPETTTATDAGVPLPFRGGVVDSLKLRNGVRYTWGDNKSGVWNSKKKEFQ